MTEVDLRCDRPSALELLDIVAQTLIESVVPATEAHARHHARVAANLCRILGRELGAEISAMPELPASMVNVGDATAKAAFVEVQELVRAKLAINKPGYDSHDAAAEADIVA